MQPAPCDVLISVLFKCLIFFALQVAVSSSDGILRLDLDFEDAFLLNGSQHASVDCTETSKEATQILIPLSNTNEDKKKQLVSSAEDEQTESEVKSRKNIIKPPMPPTKESKPTAKPEEETDKVDGLMKKVCNLLFNLLSYNVEMFTDVFLCG